MNTLKINYLAVIVAALASFMAGAAWYMGFSEAWMTAEGLTEAEIQASGGPATSMIISFIGYLIQAYVLAMLFKLLNIRDWKTGLMTGLLIYTAYIFTSTAINNSYGLRPFNLSLLNGGFGSVSGAISGAILGAWKKYA